MSALLADDPGASAVGVHRLIIFVILALDRPFRGDLGNKCRALSIDF
jgi:hypothetical protein